MIDNVSNSSIDSEESIKSAPVISKPLPTHKKIGGRVEIIVPRLINHIFTPLGGLTVDDFERAFSEVDEIYINSESEMEKHISKLVSGLETNAESWEIRINTLKDLQSTVKTCTPKFLSFPQLFRKLDSSLNDCIRDLRSQVAREACITLAYSSKLIGKSLEKSFEYLITPLLTVVQNSTKVSVVVCLFVVCLFVCLFVCLLVS